MNIALLAGSGALNLKVVYSLAPLNVEIHVIATTSTNIVGKSRHVTSFTVNDRISSANPHEEIASWLNDFCSAKAIDVIIPGDIGTAGFLASVASSLKGVAVFPCSDSGLLDRIHDKWQFASTLMRAGISTPKTVLVEAQCDLARIEGEIGFPVMIKPLTGESSHGVLRFESLSELGAYIQGGSQYAKLPLIAQTFLSGRDIDISVLADHGKVVLGVTQQLEPDGSLRFFEDSGTRALAEAVVREYGYNGIAHFDMRVEERTGELFVLECNPRFWYSMPASVWQGVNFVDIGVRLALGEVISADDALHAGRYFLPGALLGALRRPWVLRGFTLRNARGVLQPALDPIPHLVDLYRKRRPQPL